MQLDMNIYGYNFYNKDHLGNIREIVDKNGQICQKTDYYPYGTPILFDPFTINDTSHPYKYNGKELDMMHGLNTYDYGARQYNSALPLWDRVDPLAEKYYHVSPYAYCANNPVNFVDPDGEKPTIYEAALMAKHIYGNNVHLTGGWHISKTQYASFNNAQSGLKSALYERTKSGVTEYAYVTAGTQDIQDIKEDVTQLFGKGVQYKQSVDNARIINKSYS